MVPPSEWLALLQSEYLADYVKNGGSAVKVVSGAPEQIEQVSRDLREAAAGDGYFFAHLDPAAPGENDRRPDLHRIDRFFYAVARDVDWKDWAGAQARKHFADHGVRIAEDRALSDLEGIAQDNGREASDLLSEYQRGVATEQIRDRGMAVEFRAAVTALGRAQLLPHVTDENLFDDFLRFLDDMTMTRSYKPVWLLAFLQCADATGKAPVADVTRAFHDFYHARALAGEIVEHPSSRLSHPDACTLGDVQEIVNRGPFHRFSKLDYVTYAHDTAFYRMNKNLWERVTRPDTRQRVEVLCRHSLANYYQRAPLAAESRVIEDK